MEKEELLKQELLANRQQSINAENMDKESSNKCPVMHNGNHESESKQEANGDIDIENKELTNGETETVPNENQSNNQPAKPTGLGSLTTAKIETVTENLKAQSLTVQQINEYCKALFVFKNIRVMRFK